MTKYKSKFVLRMEALAALLKPRLLWDSFTKGTYIKSKHGALKCR